MYILKKTALQKHVILIGEVLFHFWCQTKQLEKENRDLLSCESKFYQKHKPKSVNHKTAQSNVRITSSVDGYSRMISLINISISARSTLTAHGLLSVDWFISNQKSYSQLWTDCHQRCWLSVDQVHPRCWWSVHWVSINRP